MDSNQAKEEQLLQLERDLDSTMNSLRRKLMVIRLLGLMSEDEKLQEEVMKNPTRLIKFLSLTFQRCATMCLLRQKSPENKEEFSGGMAEMQSLQVSLFQFCLFKDQIQSTHDLLEIILNDSAHDFTEKKGILIFASILTNKIIVVKS